MKKRKKVKKPKPVLAKAVAVKTPKVVPSIWKKDIEYLRMPDGKLRAIGRRSPKYPDENESQRHVRLWCNIPDKARVMFDSPLATPVEKKPSKVYSTKKQEPVREAKGVRWCSTAGPAIFKLKSTKWKDVRRWAKLTLEHYTDEGKFLTIQGLLSSLPALGLPYKKEQIVRKKLEAVYAPELQRDRAILQLLLERRTAPPETDDQTKPAHERKEKTERKGTPRSQSSEKDRFGFRLGTRTAKINQAIVEAKKPLTEKELEKIVGASSLGSHLSKMVREGVFKRTADKRYCLAEKQAEKKPGAKKKKKNRAAK